MALDIPSPRLAAHIDRILAARGDLHAAERAAYDDGYNLGELKELIDDIVKARSKIASLSNDGRAEQRKIAIERAIAGAAHQA